MHWLLALTLITNAPKNVFLGDTLHFTIGNTQIMVVVESMSGDTIQADGRIIVNNVFDIHVDDIEISLSAFLNGQVVVYSYGSVYAEGNDILINGVLIRNTTLSLNQNGFYGYGDVLIGNTNLRVYLSIDNSQNLMSSAYVDQFTIYGVTLQNLMLTIDNAEVIGAATLIIGNNIVPMAAGFDGYEIYFAVQNATLNFGDLGVYEFSALLNRNGFTGSGKVLVYNRFSASLSFAINNNSYLQVTDGTLWVNNLYVYNINGIISSNNISLSGTISIYDALLSVSFVMKYDGVDEPYLALTVANSQITVGGVIIRNLNLSINNRGYISGYGYVYFHNLSYPANGMVKVYFSTDPSGYVIIGISDGYVVLSNGGVINNLNAYISTEGFMGSGTYRSGSSDVTVYFYRNSQGNVEWTIYGDQIRFGDILLRHYRVDQGRAYAWWIISETDSLYFEINWVGRYATTIYPETLVSYGGLRIYNLTGTIYMDSTPSFRGTGYARILYEGGYIEIPIAFNSTPQGKLIGNLPAYITLQDGQGITVIINGITVVISQEGIYGSGVIQVENAYVPVEFYASYDGYLEARIKDGYINLGYLVIRNLNLELYPFLLTGFIEIPEVQGGIYVILKANGSGGLSVHVPGFEFTFNGFHIQGYFEHVNGYLIFSGGIQAPGGWTGSIDYLRVSSSGVDSCNITFTNLDFGGIRVVYASGIFARNPDRLILSGNFDLSATGIAGNIYFYDLIISTDGRIVSCRGVGVNNLQIGDFFVISADLELFDNYVILHRANLQFDVIYAQGSVTVIEMVFDRSGHIIWTSAVGLDYLHVGTFHASGWVRFYEEGALIDGSVSLDNIGYAYVKGLLVSYNGEILDLREGAVSVTIGAYGFYGMVTFPASNRVYIEGSVTLPQFINGSAQGSILLERTGDGRGVLGLGYNVLAGSLTIPSFNMGGYQFVNGFFAFDSIGCEGQARIDVPEVCMVELRMSFTWEGEFRYAYLAATGMNIPIGSTGLFINGAGGGVYHYTSPYEYWMFVIWGLVSDPVRALALDATLEITTDGRVSGLGHLMIAQYTWATAGFDVYYRLGYLDAFGWLGEDPSEGISFWGCYIRGQDSVYYHWVNVDAWGRGNLDIQVWFVTLSAWFGFAYDLSSWPFIYGPYWRQRLYNSGIGASGRISDYLAGINVTWNSAGRRFDYDVWWGSLDMNPGNAPYVNELICVGPFPDIGDYSINYDYLAGEEFVRPYDSYEAPYGKVWSVFNADNAGYYNFNTYTSSGVYYAGIYVHVNQPITFYLKYGIAGEYKVFKDGQVIHYGSSSYAQPDQYTIPVTLDQPGWTFLMFKIRKVWNQYGLYLRLTDANGNMVDGLSYMPSRVDHLLLYHDRGFSEHLDPYRYERQNNVTVSEGSIVLRSDGRPLWQTWIKDRQSYNRDEYPTFKVDFMLNGVARNDSTLIIMYGDSCGIPTYYGILFYYPSSKDGTVKASLVGQDQKYGDIKDFYIGRWYTLEFVFTPDSILIFAYDFGARRPEKPLFGKASTGWNPAFFATAGGNDNVLKLDNFVVRQEWKARYVNISTPHPYPNNARYRWVVDIDSSTVMRIRIKNFRTDLFDTLYIKDQNEEIWYTYSGNRGNFTTPPLLGKRVILEFNSDAAITDYGFDVDFILFNRDIPYYYTTYYPISTPHPYEANTGYQYNIYIPGAKGIRIIFNNFDTEDAGAKKDSVIIYDQCWLPVATYSGNLGTFFSYTIPGERAYIFLITDGSIQRYGFDIKYVGYITNDYFGIYDNPVTNGNILTFNKVVRKNLEIKFAEKINGAVNVKLIDVTGRVIRDDMFNVYGTEKIGLDVVNLKAGVYFLLVENEGKTLIRGKFVKVQ